MSTRYHAFKKINITSTKIHINFIRKLADGKYGLPEEKVEIVSNPAAFMKTFADANTRVLDWEVIGTEKAPYKVDKESLESWIRTHGTPCSDDEPEESVEQEQG